MATKINQINQIHLTLKKSADSNIAAHSQRFFKTGKGEYGEGDIFLGIRVPVLRKMAKQYKELSVDQILEVLTSKYHEERLLALLMLVNSYEKADLNNQKIIYTHYLNNTRFINNWDLVDSSAHKIVGAYLYTKNRKPLYTLARSKDLWERRIAIISTYYFIKKRDFEDTLKICELLIDNKEDLIHKAVGWMLREIGNQDMSTERAFLDKYYKTMPRTMLRYAIEKFPEQLRQDYLKGKL